MFVELPFPPGAIVVGVRVECLIAEELEQVAVERVGPLPDRRVDNRTSGLPNSAE
jgi:hypothetical protein